ncbi:hypothetical protein NUACC21_55950 [Scytonema sp. NUACC21]
MHRHKKETLVRKMQKNMWILMGICALIPGIHYLATVRVNQEDFFSPHVKYLTKEEVSEQPSFK